MQLITIILQMELYKLKHHNITNLVHQNILLVALTIFTIKCRCEFEHNGKSNYPQLKRDHSIVYRD